MPQRAWLISTLAKSVFPGRKTWSTHAGLVCRRLVRNRNTTLSWSACCAALPNANFPKPAIGEPIPEPSGLVAARFPENAKLLEVPMNSPTTSALQRKVSGIGLTTRPTSDDAPLPSQPPFGEAQQHQDDEHQRQIP